MRKNVFFYFNFKVKIEWNFRCTDYLGKRIISTSKNWKMKIEFSIFILKIEFP